MEVYPKRCALCGRNVADKKNSHIIPSFMVCNVSSSDGTGKRNHELTYSIGKTIKAYVGNEVPLPVMEDTFDDLSDNRIKTEFKQNPLSLDNVFCSSCEKTLANYLEGPYGNYIYHGGKCTSDEQYFFWVSVLWRISHFRILKAYIPKYIATELRKDLDNYLQARLAGAQRLECHNTGHLFYRMLKCDDYRHDSRGCIYAEYDKHNRLFSLTMGDIMVCFSFEKGDLPQNYSFLSLGEEFRSAQLNHGNAPEVCRNVSRKVFDMAYNILINDIQGNYVQDEIKMILALWKELKKRGHRLPSSLPSDQFVHQCLINIHDESKKYGERYTADNFSRSFASALKTIYGIKIC